MSVVPESEIASVVVEGNTGRTKRRQRVQRMVAHLTALETQLAYGERLECHSLKTTVCVDSESDAAAVVVGPEQEVVLVMADAGAALYFAGLAC